MVSVVSVTAEASPVCGGCLCFASYNRNRGRSSKTLRFALISRKFLFTFVAD